MTKDYYDTLGINKDSSKEEIKKAYKKLAKKYHPDLNPDSGSSEKIKEINEAYSVLSDDNKRSNYDRFGSSDEQFSGFQGQQGFNEDIFSDIFGSFFGGNPYARQRGPKGGSDLKYELNIEFKEAAFGTKKKISINKLNKCDECNGTGSEDGKQANCGTCHGSGQVGRQFRTPFGIVQHATTCPKCSGKGKIIENKCDECNGHGRKKENKTITVTIPAGVDNGSTLRVLNEGESGEQGAPSGHLYVEIHVRPHKLFERDGNDVLLDYPISFPQAALGDEIKVPTLENDIKMKIPPGTQTHTIFRLRGKGFPYLDGYGNGDQMVRIIVKTPTKLSSKQKENLEKFAKDSKEELKIEKGFFGKVKDVLMD
jgi:molecular chaperone DnaJ